METNMQIKVADILQNEALSAAKVVAGAKGINKVVTLVTVGEVPDIANWLVGGEVILSTLFAVGDNVNSQLEFVASLIKNGASALLVKPGRFIGKLDPKIIELADEKEFPLVEIPPEVRWSDIVAIIYHQIIGQHLAIQKRSFKIHRELLAEVIKGGSYSSIALTASKLINRPVILENADGDLMAASPLTKGEEQHLKDRKNPSKKCIPIVVDQETKGYVCTLETGEKLNDLDLIALEHTATVTAVEMGKEQVRIETEIRLKGDFIDDLISDEFQTEVALLKRAKFLGCDLSKGSMVLIIDIDDFENFLEKEKLKESDIQRLRREFFNSCNWIVGLEYKESLVSLKSDSVVVFLTSSAKDMQKEGLRIASSLKSGLAGRFANFSFSVGLSRYHDNPMLVKKAFNEAKIALQISKRLGETNRVISFDKVGIYKLLCNLLDDSPDELEAFYQETIGPVVEYDRKHQAELIKTLEMYFKCNENIGETAKKLYAHRHTIRYRLERINELAGLSIYSSEDKEKLALGLKLSRLLRH